jgi:hypothetical protein
LTDRDGLVIDVRTKEPKLGCRALWLDALESVQVRLVRCEDLCEAREVLCADLARCARYWYIVLLERTGKENKKIYF